MLTKAKPSDFRAAIPFDSDLLDRLMDEAGIDVLVINSKHNIQYLLGGHRSFFFDYMDASWSTPRARRRRRDTSAIASKRIRPRSSRSGHRNALPTIRPRPTPWRRPSRT
jgi:hypothetical protein